MKAIFLHAAVGVLASLGLMGSAAAQDTVTLRYATHLGATHVGVLEADIPFMTAAKKNSGGTLDFQHFPAEQAGKALQMYDLIKAGAVDIGIVSPAYVTEKMPLLGVWEIPGLASSACDIVDLMDDLGAPGGMIYESDFGPNGVRALAYLPFPGYTIAPSGKPITSLEDLHGKKIRVAGGLMELVSVALGGVPVKMPSPEIYQSLQRGTIDAVMFSYVSVKAYDMQTAAPYGTTGFNLGAPGNVVLISERKFQSLTEDQRSALIEAGKTASQHWCHYMDAAEAQSIEDLKNDGMEIYEWTPEQVAQLTALSKHIPLDWAARVDAMNKPGTEILEIFTKAMSK